MSYISFADYSALYSDLTEGQFSLIDFEAELFADNITTGIDGIKKLAVAFPTDATDVAIVKRGLCVLVNTMHKVKQMEDAAVNRGIALGGGVASVSSGSESVSYGNVNGIAAAAADMNARNKLYRQTLESYLRGVQDKYGVNLLYSGRYPYPSKVVT